MTHHETLSTLSVTAWCDTCRRTTKHRVSGKRRGPCMEHGAKGADEEGYSKRQIVEREKREAEAREPKLF